VKCLDLNLIVKVGVKARDILQTTYLQPVNISIWSNKLTYCSYSKSETVCNCGKSYKHSAHGQLL